MLRKPTVTTSIAVAVLLLVAGALVAVRQAAPARAAAGSLQQVTSFGSNPGNLAMYEYVPANLPASAPMVVALHGCGQTANDYYAHSGWPELADRHGFAVVFPQQSSANQALSCFTWYDPAKDARGNGEAASIKAMVDYEKGHRSIDASKVFVTGLSAGAAMTADLLADYPDVFAGGSINAGIPAQCATSIAQATGCQMNDQGLTPAQWAAKVKNSYSGYSGSYPRVAIWQGTADTTVKPVNATELRDQWTAVHGVSQTPTRTSTLTGGTTRTDYGSGTPAVSLFSIAGMGHGTAVDPGSGTDQCGSTASYFLDYICSSYYSAQFWGITGTSSDGPTDPPTDPTTPPSGTCVTATNYAHVGAGRAYQSGGHAIALGSNQDMGLYNVYTSHALRESKSGYWEIADGQC